MRLVYTPCRFSLHFTRLALPLSSIQSEQKQRRTGRTAAFHAAACASADLATQRADTTLPRYLRAFLPTHLLGRVRSGRIAASPSPFDRFWLFNVPVWTAQAGSASFALFAHSFL